MTNLEKFVEVFGFKPATIRIHNCASKCSECERYNVDGFVDACNSRWWWGEQYEERTNK